MHSRHVRKTGPVCNGGLRVYKLYPIQGRHGWENSYEEGSYELRTSIPADRSSASNRFAV
jgi:hypothetical protein